MKKYIVDLDEGERNELEQLTTKGRSGARKIRRARILLLADEGRIDKEIDSFLGSAVTTVERVRKRFVEAERAKQTGGDGFVAFHCFRRSGEAEATLPTTIIVAVY